MDIEHNLATIMYIPPFHPADVLMVEEWIACETIPAMLFQYCNGHITGCYSFYDELSNLALECEWPEHTETMVLQSLCRMGTLLFQVLCTNTALIPLIFGDILNVQLMPNNSWLVIYTANQYLDLAGRLGVINASGNTISFQPGVLNTPYASRGEWLSSVIDEYGNPVGYNPA